MLSKKGEIRRDEICLDTSGAQIDLYKCHGSKGNQNWEYNDEVIMLLKLQITLFLILFQNAYFLKQFAKKFLKLAFKKAGFCTNF